MSVESAAKLDRAYRRLEIAQRCLIGAQALLVLVVLARLVVVLR